MAELPAEVTVSPRWRDAFGAVDRGWFVPEFLVPHPDRAGWLPVRAPSARWRAGVDSTDALITQVDGRAHDATIRDGDPQGAATSSTSSPTLMAAMLEALDVEPGHRVLEIGTGTGYNAALLSHRLGDQNVTTVDIDADLVDLARRRLADNGYRPSVHVADAIDGWPAGGPYDRIIATVALPDIPAAWHHQLAPGGKILIPLDRHGAGGLLAVFQRHDDVHDDAFDGRLLNTRGYFMPLRANSSDPADVMASALVGAASTTTTDLPVDSLSTPGGPAEHVIALATGGFGRIDFTPAATGTPEIWLTRPDGSWARLTADTTDSPGVRAVSQGGPHRLWDTVEHAHRRWNDLGRPTREAVRLRSSPAGLQPWVHTSTGAHLIPSIDGA